MTPACADQTPDASVEPQLSTRLAPLGDGSPGAPFPITAPATAAITLAQGDSAHYQLTVTAGHDGLRVALVRDAAADLVLRRQSATGAIVQSSSNKASNTVFVRAEDPTADELWFIEAHADAAITCGLRADPIYARALTWDAGAAPSSASAITPPDSVGGDGLYVISS